MENRVILTATCENCGEVKGEFGSRKEFEKVVTFADPPIIEWEWGAFYPFEPHDIAFHSCGARIKGKIEIIKTTRSK